VQLSGNGEQQTDSRLNLQSATEPAWVKRSGLLAGLLFLLITAMLLGLAGPHGPVRHLPQAMAATLNDWRYVALITVLFLAALTFNQGRLNYIRDALALGPVFAGMAKYVWIPNLNLPARLRKWILVVHVTTSVGAAGAVAVFLVLSITGSTAADLSLSSACYRSNALIARYVISPLVVCAIMVGICQALATPWGLFRHYWILAKLYLTVTIWLVLLVQMDGISALARTDLATNAAIDQLKQSQLIHSAAGLVLLIVIVAISVFKPRGLTAHGQQRSAQPSRL